jgi:hypothetical protein
MLSIIKLINRCFILNDYHFGSVWWKYFWSIFKANFNCRLGIHSQSKITNPMCSKVQNILEGWHDAVINGKLHTWLHVTDFIYKVYMKHKQNLFLDFEFPSQVNALCIHKYFKILRSTFEIQVMSGPQTFQTRATQPLSLWLPLKIMLYIRPPELTHRVTERLYTVIKGLFPPRHPPGGTSTITFLLWSCTGVHLKLSLAPPHPFLLSYALEIIFAEKKPFFKFWLRSRGQQTP